MLDIIHSDVQGPMEVESWGGARYCVIFVDDFSRKTFGYMIKHKSEVFVKFKLFKALVENQLERKIKCLRSDNGGEYIDSEFKNFLAVNGIKHQTTIPRTPQWNCVSERTLRTISEKARCLLCDSGLDKRFWAEAYNTAIYLKNVSPTAALEG